MNNAELCRAYELAEDKREAIIELARATDTDTETVVEVLCDAGLYARECKGELCGAQFKKLLSPACRNRENEKQREQASKAALEKWVRYQIAQNEQRKASLLRQAVLITLENIRLGEVLK